MLYYNYIILYTSNSSKSQKFSQKSGPKYTEYARGAPETHRKLLHVPMLGFGTALERNAGDSRSPGPEKGYFLVKIGQLGVPTGPKKRGEQPNFKIFGQNVGRGASKRLATRPEAAATSSMCPCYELNPLWGNLGTIWYPLGPQSGIFGQILDVLTNYKNYKNNIRPIK